jgi:hypothetical protein
MNKRIRELSKEAGLVADATYAKAPDAIWLKEYNKKFAELIVKECVEIANENDGTWHGSGVAIKKHFGVEE